ncbi:MAG: MFS transporter [Chloroflexi bacterium]|nr:MFS transporter [Chloroflexota bacterium]
MSTTQSPPPEAAPARRTRGFSFRTFDSLKQVEFRWLFASLLGQMAAIQMQILMRSYVVYELTASFAAIGVVALASAVPMLLLSVFGGVLADRMPRKQILQIGHVLNGGFAFLIATLLLLDVLTVEHLFVIALLQGTVLALTISAGQAIVPEVAGMERLMNAVSLNAAGMSFMRLVAPAVAAGVIAAVGAGSAYLTIGIFYAMALLLLAPVRTRRPGAMQGAPPGAPAGGPGARQGAPPGAPAGGPPGGTSGGFGELIAGLRYAYEHKVIFWVLVLNFVTAILAMPYMVQLPGYVADVFEGGPGMLAWFAAVSGAGSLLATLVIASLPERRRGALLLGSSALLGLSLAVYASTSVVWLGLLFMFVVGVWTAGRQALAMVIIQTQVEDTHRGRVMSIFMTQISMVLIGGFIVGLMAEATGIQTAIGGLGLVLAVFTLGVAVFVPRLRRVT